MYPLPTNNTTDLAKQQELHGETADWKLPEALQQRVCASVSACGDREVCHWGMRRRTDAVGRAGPSRLAAGGQTMARSLAQSTWDSLCACPRFRMLGLGSDGLARVVYVATAGLLARVELGRGG